MLSAFVSQIPVISDSSSLLRNRVTRRFTSFQTPRRLTGHAEFGGKTMFLKFNTGPSAHGLPASVGEALALKKAGLSEFKVFAIEGEGALTAGGSHEAKNGAWGYGLGNLYWLVDWNDFGIDDRRTSSVVFGGLMNGLLLMVGEYSAP